MSALTEMENDTGQRPLHQTVDEITDVGSDEAWDLTAAGAGITGTDGNFLNRKGPYMVDIPADPWRHPHSCDSDGIHKLRR